MEKTFSRKGKLSELISENEFNEFINARKAARAGEYDRAINIARKTENALKNKLDSKYFS